MKNFLHKNEPWGISHRPIGITTIKEASYEHHI